LKRSAARAAIDRAHARGDERATRLRAFASDRRDHFTRVRGAFESAEQCEEMH